jgi:hypothetical protein
MFKMLLGNAKGEPIVKISHSMVDVSHVFRIQQHIGQWFGKVLALVYANTVSSSPNFKSLNIGYCEKSIFGVIFNHRLAAI